MPFNFSRLQPHRTLVNTNILNKLIGKINSDQQLFFFDPRLSSLQDWLLFNPLLNHLHIEELSNLSITNELFTLLSPQQYLQTLSIEDTGHQDDLFWFLFSSTIEQNHRLESLSMTLCNWTSSAFYIIASAIYSLPQLKILNLSGNNLNRGPLFRGIFSKKTILSLDLEHCSIDDTGLANWIDELKKNPNLTSLNLGLNPITDASFETLYSYILDSKNLTFLSLDGTKLSLDNQRSLIDLINIRKSRLYVGLDAVISGRPDLLTYTNHNLVRHHCSMIPLVLKGLITLDKTCLIFKEYYEMRSLTDIAPTILLQKMLHPEVQTYAEFNELGFRVSFGSRSFMLFSSTPCCLLHGQQIYQDTIKRSY